MSLALYDDRLLNVLRNVITSNLIELKLQINKHQIIAANTEVCVWPVKQRFATDRRETTSRCARKPVRVLTLYDTSLQLLSLFYELMFIW